MQAGLPPESGLHHSFPPDHLYNVLVKKYLSWKKLSEYFIYFFILLLPTQFGKHFFFDFSYISGVRIDYLAPTLYLTDIIAIILFVLNWKSIVASLNAKTFIFFAGLILLNIIFSLSFPIALYKSLKILEIILILTVIHKNKLSLKNIIWAFLIGGLFEFLLSIFQFIHKKSLDGFFYFFGERHLNLSMPDIAKASYNGLEILRPYGTFSHPNSLAGFYLLIYFFVISYKPFEKYFFLRHALLLVSSMLVFLSFSKIIIGIYLILNLYYIIKRTTAYNCILCLVSRVLILFTLSYTFLTAHGDPDSITKRLQLLSNSFTIILQNPVLGVGQGNYLIAQSKFPIPYSYHFLQPVHNIFMLFLTESGLLLTVPTVYFIFKRLKKYVTDAYTLPLLAVLLTGLFDHYWLTLQQNMLLIPVVFALLSRKIDPKV